MQCFISPSVSFFRRSILNLATLNSKLLYIIVCFYNHPLLLLQLELSVLFDTRLVSRTKECNTAAQNDGISSQNNHVDAQRVESNDYKEGLQTSTLYTNGSQQNKHTGTEKFSPQGISKGVTRPKVSRCGLIGPTLAMLREQVVKWF